MQGWRCADSGDQPLSKPLSERRQLSDFDEVFWLLFFAPAGKLLQRES
jgi:hypothetical protein